MKDINLVPRWYVQEKTKKTYWAYMIAAGCVLLALTIAIPAATRVKYQIQKNILESRLKNMGDYIPTLKQLNSVYALYKSRAEQGDMIREADVDVPALFEELEKASGPRMFIVSLNLNRDDSGLIKARIKGIAASDSDISEFVRRLRESDRFGGVSLGLVSNISGLGVTSAQARSIGEGQSETAANPGYSFDVSLILKAKE